MTAQPRIRRAPLVAALLAGLLAPTAAADDVERPFVMWNAAELAAIRQRIEDEPWANAEWEAKPDNRAEQALHDLLAWRLYGDEAAADRQKEKLLRDMRSTPPLGGAQWVNVVRFDMLHDRLSGNERADCEKAFRRFIDHAIFENALFDPDVFNDERNYSRYDAKYYRRNNWLPNIAWPRRISANLMAAALGDEQLIRRTWSHYGSWQWYFDAYLADSGFYGEEFSKMGATPGAMLVYCEAVENLGLGELGYGYKGRSGATMRGHIRSLIRMGYPRLELHSTRPQYPMVTMGDLRQGGSSAKGSWPTNAFQHSIVPGFLPDGFGGNTFWRAHGAWGGTRRGNHAQWDGYTGFTPKMQIPFWFEAAHARWPADGYAYFLAAIRPPQDDRYVPSLYFGIEPVEPAAADPPPAPSWIAPQRGIVMLRAEESPDYWRSPAPAVAMRLASPYAHSCRDSFALLGLFAYNRQMYMNRQVTPGYARAYTRSILSHCGVMADGEEPAFTYDTTTRSGFYDDVKFAAADSPSLFDGIHATRALLLTDDYLFDAYRLAGDSDHELHWVVHALGECQVGGNWSRPHPFGGVLEPFGRGRSLPTDDAWSVTVTQTCALADASKARLPRAWYDRRIGVKLHMLGAPGTAVHVTSTPVADTPDDAPSLSENPQVYEVGGTSVIVRREAANTTFAALHVPFEGGKPKGLMLRRIGEGDDHLAVAVKGPGHDEMIAVKFADHGKPVTIADGQRFVTFADHAFVRVVRGAVWAWGDVRALELPVPGKSRRLYLNGRLTPAKVEGGLLRYGD
jgi:hypothetical protein